MATVNVTDLSNRLCEQAVRAHRAYESQLNVPGDTAYSMRLHFNGRVIGLRVALCLLHGWDAQDESDKEGKADDLITAWWQANDPAYWS